MSTKRKLTVAMLISIFCSVASNLVHAQMQTMTRDHVMVVPSDIKWADNTNPVFLPGTKIAVIDGDPSSTGPYTLRLMIPNGWRVMPHYHPTDENITVLKGNFMMGVGDKFEETDMKSLSEGSYMSMKAGTHHYAIAKGETIIQVHGMGPFQLTYVNAADDPRNKTTK